jgi:outer membrane protein TolC
MRYLIIIGLWLVSYNTFSATQDPLAQIVRAGYKNAYSIKTQQLREQQVDYAHSNAIYAFLPILSLSSGKSWSEAESLSGTEKIPSNTTSNTASVTANWTLWDNYQNIRNYQSADYSKKIEILNTEKETQLYILNLLESYYSLQLLLSNKENLHGLLSQAKWTRDESQALVSAGARTQLDAMDTEIEVANAERDLRELESQVASSERNLRVLLNTKDLSTLPRIDLIKHMPYFLVDTTATISKAKQYSNVELEQINAELHASKLSLEKSINEFSQTKLNYWPKTSVQVSHDFNMNRYVQDIPTDGVRTYLQTTTLTFSLSWTLWDWFTTGRNIKSSANELEVTRLKYSEGILRTESDLQSLLDQYEINERSVESSKLIVEKSDKQLNYSREMYRLGKINLLNLQQSTNRVFDSKNSLALRMKNKFLLYAKIKSMLGLSLLPQEKD